MDNLPLEPESFAAHVIEKLRQQFPSRQAEVTGPLHVVFDGRHLGLENLYRMVLRDPRNAQDIVDNYLERLFEGDQISGAPLPLSVARSRIMPRIQPDSIFEHLDREQVAHVPFVNDTSIVFVIDLPQLTVSITTEQMIRWGLQSDDLDAISRENLARYAPDLEVRFVDSHDGGRAAIVAQQDGYDAARLLLSSLYDRLRSELRGDFYVAAPARDTFIAISVGPNPFVERLKQRVEEDYRRLPYPITRELFYVTRDGVAGTLAA
ncbi:MAG: DUF1444 family protein [Planctomycetaceae bacterium]|jgi:uncharacterized protein YtpQ (UPF0354 family)|nr:DUF1444 family protein [Planctomycetaceae bacterium]